MEAFTAGGLVSSRVNSDGPARVMCAEGGVRMRSTALALALTAFAIAAALPALVSGRVRQEVSQAAPGVAAVRPTSAAEYDRLFKQISNWGRWGNDDRRGTANLLTAAKRIQAAALVKAELRYRSLTTS